MSALPILEVAIGLSFTYLLLALITTTATEWITRVANARGKTLKQGLRQLLGEEEGTARGVTDAVLDHPLIASLAQVKGKGRRMPSYIPSELFAKALTSVVGSRGKEGVSPHLQQALKSLTPGAGESIVMDQTAIERWYDQHMDRVSGWYKRHTQSVVLTIAAVLTLLTNTDSVTLARRLWSDSALRQTVVEAAKVRLQQGPPLNPVEYIDPTTPRASKPLLQESSNEVLPEEHALLERLVGWSGEPDRLAKDPAGWIAVHLFGWLITALAVSLGAPFWF